MLAPSARLFVCQLLTIEWGKPFNLNFLRGHETTASLFSGWFANDWNRVLWCLAQTIEWARAGRCSRPIQTRNTAIRRVSSASTPRVRLRVCFRADDDDGRGVGDSLRGLCIPAIRHRWRLPRTRAICRTNAHLQTCTSSITATAYAGRCAARRMQA